ncbi:MAG: hypothetical protein NTW85_12420 [Methylococcales bacterium]|nr:hypothetical protein [Methylococcales bacterium]
MKPYTVTQIADAAKNNPVESQKARELAYRLGNLRGDLWNKFGGVQAWGEKPDGHHQRSDNCHGRVTGKHTTDRDVIHRHD